MFTFLFQVTYLFLNPLYLFLVFGVAIFRLIQEGFNLKSSIRLLLIIITFASWRYMFFWVDTIDHVYPKLFFYLYVWGSSFFTLYLTGFLGNNDTFIRGANFSKVKNKKGEITIGNVGINKTNECQHFLIAGKTGCGKSQAIYELLQTVFERKQVVIFADPHGAYYSRFGRDNDILINPFDKRSVLWSPFLEIKHEYDCDNLALSIIPETEGSSKEWNFYARTMLSESLKYLWNKKDFSIGELLRIMLQADISELQTIFQHSTISATVSNGNEKMLGSIRSTASGYLSSYKYLYDSGNFSIKNWLKKARVNKDSRLFITYADSQLTILKYFISALLDVAITELLSQDEAKNEDDRVFFIADELDSLGAIGSLKSALTKSRKYGGVCVAGIQSISQLRSNYGRDNAQTLLSCFSNKYLMSAGDNETADYFSKEMGDYEVKQKNVSLSNSKESTKTISYQEKTKKIILPSEFMNLENLSGYLRANQTIYKTKIKYRDIKSINNPIDS